MKVIYYSSVVLILCLMSQFSISQIQVLGSLLHSHNGKPGDIYKGEISIQNISDIEQEVKIYQTDLLYNYEGYTYYDEPVSHKRSNSKWLMFTPKTTILMAKETKFIQYEIKIPKADSINGTYWSVLMIEGVSPIDPEQKGQLTINTLIRYAVQIVTNMKESNKPKLQFMEPKLNTEDKNLFLDIVIENTGNCYISPEVSIELFDDKGQSVKKIAGTKKGLFPTTSSNFRINLEGVQAGKTYQTVIIADGEDDKVFGLEYTLYL